MATYPQAWDDIPVDFRPVNSPQILAAFAFALVERYAALRGFSGAGAADSGVEMRIRYPLENMQNRLLTSGNPLNYLRNAIFDLCVNFVNVNPLEYLGANNDINGWRRFPIMYNWHTFFRNDESLTNMFALPDRGANMLKTIDVNNEESVANFFISCKAALTKMRYTAEYFNLPAQRLLSAGRAVLSGSGDWHASSYNFGSIVADNELKKTVPNNPYQSTGAIESQHSVLRRGWWRNWWGDAWEVVYDAELSYVKYTDFHVDNHTRLPYGFIPVVFPDSEHPSLFSSGFKWGINYDASETLLEGIGRRTTALPDFKLSSATKSVDSSLFPSASDLPASEPPPNGQYDSGYHADGAVTFDGGYGIRWLNDWHVAGGFKFV